MAPVLEIQLGKAMKASSSTKLTAWPAVASNSALQSHVSPATVAASAADEEGEDEEDEAVAVAGSWLAWKKDLNGILICRMSALRGKGG